MRWFRTFVGGILAGISIAIGGTVFLSLENKVLGALFFTVGLFAVCTFGFNLFTGKVCYVLENDRAFALSLPLIWLGNLCGTGLTALCSVIFTVLHWPCSTTLLTVKKETGSWKWTVLSALVPTVMGLALCAVAAALGK